MRFLDWLDEHYAKINLALWLAMFGVLIAMVSSCSPYAAAWRTTSAVHAAGGVADKAIALAVRREADKCIVAKAPDVPACVRASKAWAAQTDWRKVGVPAINSAIIATVATLDIAERTGSKGIDWLAVLRPAACALARVVRQWGAHLGTAKAAVLAAAGAVSGATCEEAKQ